MDRLGQKEAKEEEEFVTSKTARCVQSKRQLDRICLAQDDLLSSLLGLDNKIGIERVNEEKSAASNDHHLI